MRIPEPLPPALAAGPFTTGEADASGMTRSRLRHSRIERISRSIRWVDTQDQADFQNLPLHVRCRPYTRVTPSSVASHRTAADVWGFPLHNDDDGGLLHLTRLTGMSPQRRGGVCGHTGRLFRGEVCVEDGLSLTSRERTWLDLAQCLTVTDLTVIADHLLRLPRPDLEHRTEPYATKESLQETIGRHSGKRGIRKARLALELSRVGADSPPETRLRLLLADAGLPEPRVNAPIVDDAGIPHHEPDLSYPEYRVAVEYEGAGHSTPDQVERDISREERIRALGWREIRISRRHMADDGRAAVSKVRSELFAAGWRPGPPSV